MTENQRALSRQYLTYKFLSNLWFLSAVWLYFYRLFITDAQVGVLDSMAFAIGLLAEVPSGALADRFGRDKMVRLGQFLAGSGLLIQAAGSSFLPFVAGQSIMMIGMAFVSGADEALFFDRLKFDHNSKLWRRLVTRSGQVELVATLIATVIGAWLHTLNPRLPWLLTGLSFILSVGIIWRVRDIAPRADKQKLVAEIKGYLQDVKTGFMEFGRPQLWLYVPIIITVQGLFYTAGYGILRLILLDRFGFSPTAGAIAIATYSLISIGVLAWTHKHAEKISEKRVLTTIALSAAAGLLLSTLNIGYLGYLVILTLYLGERVLYPFMSEIINYHAPHKQRATVLSVASFGRSLPYVMLAPIIGSLNSSGKLNYFLIVWPVLICGSVYVYLSRKKVDALITVKE